MKTALRAAAALLALSVFSGCSAGKDAYSLANDVKTHYNNSRNEPVTASVTADYGDRMVSFTLRMQDGEITILAPEELSGVTARLADGGMSLVYSGAEVFTGAVTRSGLSPAAALPLMLGCFAGGTVTGAWLAGGRLTVDYYVSDTVSLRAEFDPETLAALSALLTEDGGRVLGAEFQ